MSPRQYNRAAATADGADERAGFVDAAADRCVKCALCLPVCPTWTLTRNEAESPRGRIALLQGVARDIVAAADAAAHVDRCLSCMACQSVCPANVEYGALFDAGQALLRERGAPRRSRTAVAARILESPALLRALAALSRVGRYLPAVGTGGTLRRALAMPDRTRTTLGLPPIARSGARGQVIVLQGCVTEAFERHATDALGALLNAMGYGVTLVAGCCGALSRHSGDAARATRLATRLIERMAKTDAAAILHPATGCAAVVSEFPRHVDSPAARELSAKVVDAGNFLQRAGLADRLAGLPHTPQRVALHAPCTQRNVTGGAGAMRSLIGAMPGVTCVPLTTTSCCGAAGSNMLSEPQTADALAATTLAALDGDDIAVLLTPNIGCAWHLRGYRIRTQQPLRVTHPAVFLAERLHAARTLI